MDALHTHFMPGAATPQFKPVAFRNIRQMPRLALPRLIARQPEQLLLISRPGAEKMSISDQLIRIAEVDAISKQNCMLQTCFELIMKILRLNARCLRVRTWLTGDSKPIIANGKGTSCWNTFERESGVGINAATLGDPHLPALIASFNLRQWVTAE